MKNTNVGILILMCTLSLGATATGAYALEASQIQPAAKVSSVTLTAPTSPPASTSTAPYDYDCALMTGLSYAAGVCEVSDTLQLPYANTDPQAQFAYAWAFKFEVGNLIIDLENSSPQTQTGQTAVQTILTNSRLALQYYGQTGNVWYMPESCYYAESVFTAAAAALCPKSARGY